MGTLTKYYTYYFTHNHVYSALTKTSGFTCSVICTEKKNKYLFFLNLFFTHYSSVLLQIKTSFIKAVVKVDQIKANNNKCNLFIKTTLLYINWTLKRWNELIN